MSVETLNVMILQHDKSNSITRSVVMFQRINRPKLNALFNGHRWQALAVAVMLLSGGMGRLGAATIPVPNGSFESPVTDFAWPDIDDWQKSAKPVWWDDEVYPWYQETGLFYNYDPVGMTNYIDNADGNQVMFLFSVPEVAVFQDYETIGGTNTAPTHAFDAQYQVGNSYQLTVGVVNSQAQPPMEGATLEASLYYLDAETNRVTVAATTVVYSAATFSNTTQLLDYQVNVPAVQPDDPWAGRYLGIQFLATVGFESQGGVWDLDNVRLLEFGPPSLRALGRTNGVFKLELDSQPGLEFEILASPDLTEPLANWTSLGTITNTSGTAVFPDEETGFSQRFYRARQVP